MLSKHYFLNFNHVKRISCLNPIALARRHESTTSSEYTSTPNYPPILSLKPREVEKRVIETKAEKLKKVHTVEEKLLAINMPRYWGWMSVMINEGVVPYNFFPFVQHITRTRMIEVDSLPVPLPDAKFQEIIKIVKDKIQETIAFELCHKNHKFHSQEPGDLTEMKLNELLGKAVIEQINRCILSTLAPHAPHLFDVLVDYEPRHEAFWNVGGFYISADEKKHKKYYNDFWERSNDRLDDPIDRWIQYIGSPVLALRSRFPLDPIADFPGPTVSETAPKPVEAEAAKDASKDKDKVIAKPVEEGAEKVEPLEVAYEIPSLKYDPRVMHGLEFKRQYGLTVPGFFPNDRHEFGFLSYHKRNHMLGRSSSFGTQEHDEALHAQAILASYCWTLGQACYQGFSTYNNPTYPLTAQTVITDGRLWSFYAYQLNTTTFYDEKVDTNPHQNVCYGVKTTELYHSIEDGQIKGWNDKALETLISFYMNKYREREGVTMKPYIDPEESLLEDIKDDEKRMWLQKQTWYILSRIRKHERPPTIYEWEQIYRIDNFMTFMDARHKFYQKGEDPLNEDTWPSRCPPTYIPRKERKLRKEPWHKFETAYWPDALC